MRRLGVLAFGARVRHALVQLLRVVLEWFASRYAVLLSVMYRNGELRNVVEGERYVNGLAAPGFVPGPVFNSEGDPFKLDVGCVGFRLGVMIGL